MAQGFITRRGGSGGSTTVPLTITVTMSDGTSAAGRVVVITDTDAGTVFARHEYTGDVYTVAIPIGMRYRVEVEYYYGYQAPEAVTGTALAGTKRNIEFVFVRGILYGYKREKANSAPDARIIYLYDALGMTPAYMDFKAGTFNWGDWKPFVESIARPVMLKTDGTVDYELDHDDQTKKLDGTASDVDNTAYDGNAMVEFGKAFQWVKRYEDSEFEYVIFCDVQFDDSYHAYAHTNEAGDVQDAFYWGMFMGTLLDDRLRSFGTARAAVNVNRQTEINRAVANGDGYFTIYKSGRDYIDDLLTLISKSDDSQAAFGRGRTSSSSVANGTLISKPSFYGESASTSNVKVLWIEGHWGNLWESLAGFILDGNNGIKTKMVPPYNLTGDGYAETGIVPTGSSGGYISAESVTDEAGLVPVTVGGSATTFMCDGLWFRTSVVGYALICGDFEYGALCGSRCLSLYHVNTSVAADIGARLSYIRPSA